MMNDSDNIAVFFLVYKNLTPDLYRKASTLWEAVEVIWVHRIAPARAPRDHRRCVGDLWIVSDPCDPLGSVALSVFLWFALNLKIALRAMPSRFLGLLSISKCSRFARCLPASWVCSKFSRFARCRLPSWVCSNSQNRSGGYDEGR